MENNEKDIFERLENLELVCIILLFELAEKTTSTKDRILQDMIAKAASLGKSIRLLYKEGLYNEGWSLYRTLIDRLSHIYQLDKENSYEDFADWSFKILYDYNNNARNTNFKKSIRQFEVTNEDKKKYHQIVKSKIKWARARVEDVLKEKDLDFVYKFGYDYASHHIHPMDTDGRLEFYKLTKLEPNPYKSIDYTILISNTLIISTLLLQRILNCLSFKFRKAVFDYLTYISSFNEGDDEQYKYHYIIIAKMGEQEIGLCE